MGFDLDDDTALQACYSGWVGSFSFYTCFSGSMGLCWEYFFVVQIVKLSNAFGFGLGFRRFCSIYDSEPTYGWEFGIWRDGSGCHTLI